MAKVRNLQVHSQTGENLLYARWDFTVPKANTFDHYEVRWFYDPGNGIWYDGGSSNTDLKNATYTVPEQAYYVQCKVRPVSKTYTRNNKEVSYWTGENSYYTYCVESIPPDAPSAPTVSIDKYTLKATLDNIEDKRVDQIGFLIVDEQGNKVDYITVNLPTVSDKPSRRAMISRTVKAGYKYRVACRAINNYTYGARQNASAWSPYSTEVSTIPKGVTNVKCTIETETSVKVSWDADPTAKSYTVEYTTNKLYFDSSSEVSSITVEAAYAYITGLETGEEWFFRVKSTNDQGDSGWSAWVNKIMGTKPEAPTTWSLTSKATVGESMILYWVHNSEDGSKQREAQIELTVNGDADIITIDTSESSSDEDEEEKIYSYTLDLTKYSEGAEILWRVRTRGITYDYSDWSVQRTIDIYAPPVAELHLGDDTGILTQFPYNISISVGPDTQKAITCNISITAVDAYETTNQIGETVFVNAGEEIYSKVVNAESNNISYELMPEDITLENNQSYTVNVTVSMDSGLLAEATDMFLVTWSDNSYEPDASITIDKNTLCAYIIPVCYNPDDGSYVDGIVLSVYRREYDGEFTEIATNIDNNGITTVTDAHPALDYARYRIVARNINTNVNSYIDLPGIPVSEPSVVIQWDEDYEPFDYSDEGEPVIPPWTGSMIRIPYNIDVDESYSPDRSLVEYIGRKHPVDYHGTQKGVSENWKMEIPKSDTETIYSLRRLAAWSGNVYVREPSGKGYRATVTVSMSITHKSVVVPVTLDVTRVEDDES